MKPANEEKISEAFARERTKVNVGHQGCIVASCSQRQTSSMQWRAVRALGMRRSGFVGETCLALSAANTSL